MSEPLRVLVVDDEPAARQNLRRLLAAIPATEIVGELGDGRAAVERVRGGGVDLVLLDVQMPELDGLAVVREVGVHEMPPVVFVTAYDEHALAAFDLYACGYLLKPVQAAKLAALVERTRRGASAARAGEGASQSERLARVLEQLSSNRFPRRLAVKQGGRTVFVATRDVERIEGADNLVRIHARGGATLETRETLSNLERLLSPHEFVRVHRSTIVRVDRIAEVQPWFNGDYVCIMADGARVVTGRTYRGAVQRLLTHG